MLHWQNIGNRNNALVTIGKLLVESKYLNAFVKN